MRTSIQLVINGQRHVVDGKSAFETLKLYKVSRRRDMDISTFTAAIMLTIEADQESQDRITDARIALGGVGPTVIRARQTEEFLVGREFTEESMRQAGTIARTEITPIDDVRGSKEYRFQLAENVLLKYFQDFSPTLRFVGTTISGRSSRTSRSWSSRKSCTSVNRSW